MNGAHWHTMHYKKYPGENAALRVEKRNHKRDYKLLRF